MIKIMVVFRLFRRLMESPCSHKHFLRRQASSPSPILGEFDLTVLVAYYSREGGDQKDLIFRKRVPFPAVFPPDRVT